MRKAEEELAKQESGKATEEARDDQPLKRTYPAKVRDDDIDRHKNHRERDHQGRQDSEEDLVSPSIGNACQPIASQRRNEDLPYCLQNGDSRGINEPV